jgi:hypothetical protein
MDLNTIEQSFKKIVNSQGIRNIAQAPLLLKITEMVHHFTYAKRDKFMGLAIYRYTHCVNKKPMSQINKEIKLCENYWGCYPTHYFRYDLYKKDKELSNNELLNFVPEFFFYYLFLPYYNPKNLEYILENKNTSEKLFRRYNISQPQIFCRMVNGKLYSLDMNEMNFVDFKHNFLNRYYKKIFIKPFYGKGGKGIFIFHLNGKNKYQTNNGLILDEEFLEKIGKKEDYIIQPGIEQTFELSKIYPYSVNTFRIITENKNNNIKVLYAVLRMGRNKNELDNLSQNGICVPIDCSTGEMGEYAISLKCEMFEKHPDTNFAFHGYLISNWSEIKELVKKNAEKISQFSYIAWDVALTDEGPITIEANLRYGLDGVQIALNGLRELYGIDDPKFYWRNKGKRV